MNELHVLIHSERAGVVTPGRGGRLRLTYAESYRAAGRTPLSVSMPTEIADHPHRAIAPWLAGLLPDDPDVIRRWSRRFRTNTTPFSLLSTPLGEDCAGAVQLVTADRVEAMESRAGEVEWLTDEDVADRIEALRADRTAWLGRADTGRFSLGGAQAKTALLRSGGRWGLPRGATPTSHILKPAISGFDDHDLNEHLCLEAARAAGLPAVRTTVERFGETRAIVVRRYDRAGTAGGLVRVHQEDLCQALSVPPEGKYEADGGPGALSAIRLLREVMPPRAADEAVERFVDALIWNWLIGGTDAHAKNYSLLLGGDQVRLAPLYDVASALPYPGINERELRLAMRIGRDYRVHLEHNPWPRAAREWGLPYEWLQTRIVDLASRAGDAFADAGADPGVVDLGSPLPERLTDLVADRARRCQALVEAPPE